MSKKTWSQSTDAFNGTYVDDGRTFVVDVIVAVSGGGCGQVSPQSASRRFHGPLVTCSRSRHGHFLQHKKNELIFKKIFRTLTLFQLNQVDHLVGKEFINLKFKFDGRFVDQRYSNEAP